MTPTILETMKQALEALEETTALCINYEAVEEADGYQFTEAKTVIPMGNSAITALRAAIKAMEDAEIVTHDPTVSREHLLAIAKKCDLIGNYTTREIVDAVTGYAQVVLRDKAVQEAFLRANPHPAPAVPEGWQLVPKEPTEEMLAGIWGKPLTRDDQGARRIAKEKYKAMLSTAPELKL